MPNLFTLPGPRPGPDNVFAQQVLAEGSHQVVAAGAAVYAALFRIYWSDHNNVNFTNHGTIWNITSEGTASSVAGFYIWEFTNTGTIVAEAANSNSGGVSILGGGDRFVNTGTIFAIANGNATAVTHWGPDIKLSNSGMIAAYAPNASTGGSGGVGSALALGMFNGGRLDNLAGGSILAEGLSATAIIFSRGKLIDPGFPLLRNAGRIEAYALDPAQESIAILTAALTVETMTIENSGIIRADIAYRSDSEIYYSPPGQAPDEIVNLAAGRIYGRIETALGADSVVNFGEIHGDLLMGEGADLVDSAQGVLDGIADMGWGEDRFLGGGGDNAALGGRDADWLDGGAGHDLLLGGLGDDVLVGGSGNDGLFGEYGNDRIVTAGGDSVDAGAGDDVIEIGDLAFRSILAGDGLDRLVLAIGARSLDVAAVRASGRLGDVEMIEMRGEQRLVLRADDVRGLTGGDDSLRLFTTASDRVELIGAWAEAGTTNVGGVNFRRFTLAGEVALVAGTGSVAIGAAPSAPAEGLDPVASGPAAPLPGSVPGVALSSPITVLNNYKLHGDEVVQSYETWRSEGGQPILRTSDSDFSLTNYGLIESTGPGNGGAKALFIGNIDRIVNYGILRAVGSGAAYADAIFGSGGWGGLTNYGLIEAIAEAGQATGIAISGAHRDDANFENYGTISARTNGAAKATGAIISRDDFALNHGTISALGGDGTIGAGVTEQRMFTNWGTITADVVAGMAGTATGLLYLGSVWGSSFVNHGLIQGDRAIAAGAGVGSIGSANFFNSGRLEGSVELDDGNNRFENRGTIVGDARLGAGIDLWFGAEGLHQGAVFGGEGSDMLIGSAAGDTLNGEAGDDYLRGGGGADQLAGGAGRDLFVYTHFGESTAAALDVIADFTSGTDRIDLTALGVLSVSLQAGAGFTMLTATTAQGTLQVRVNGTLAQSDLILAAAPTITGTADADMLVATAGGGILNGGGGNDLLVGAAGGDRLDGGAGFDLMWGGAGNDVYVVDNGSDVVWELTGQGADLIEVSGGALTAMPDNVEHATLIEAGFVRGNGLANTIRGSAGNDQLLGGGAGNDQLFGGAGDDRIEGGAGWDRMTGGAGADTFVFLLASDSVDTALRSDGAKLMPDLILDFTSGTDKISLVSVRYLEGGWALFPAFSFIGTGAFTHHVGEVRYAMSGGQAHIFVDMDGDAIADMHIVANTMALAASDFIF